MGSLCIDRTIPLTIPCITNIISMTKILIYITTCLVFSLSPKCFCVLFIKSFAATVHKDILILQKLCYFTFHFVIWGEEESGFGSYTDVHLTLHYFWKLVLSLSVFTSSLSHIKCTQMWNIFYKFFNMFYWFISVSLWQNHTSLLYLLLC
jgi:hypothetical protein